MSDLIGRTLGPYRILEEIGRGGMATVYRAVQPSIGREVAIKLMPAHFLQDPTFSERFYREVQVIARLQHPRILPVHDFGQQDGQPYIVVACLTGGTLSDRILQSDAGMPLEEVTRFVIQIAEGLDFAHKEGIIHRDFKPSNVLLDRDDNAYLADFGIAKVAEATVELTGSGVVGTPAYMAPEMVEGGAVTPLVDVYALGVTLYYMLTGRLPYDAPSPVAMLMAHMSKPVPDVRQWRPDLPDPVQDVVERAMAKKPAARFQSAGDLAAALRSTVAPGGADFRPAPAAATTHVPPEPEQPTVTQVPSAVDASPAIGPPPARRRGLPTWAWIVIGLPVLACLCVVGALVVLGNLGEGANLATATPEDTPTPAVTVDPYQLAVDGVTRNADWTPVVQEFDGVEMVLVPVGCFTMGSDSGDEEEKPAHEQCVTRAFWIDRHEVTNAQYGSHGEYPGDDFPRERVTWFEALEFCQGRGMRLPTEVEWEYAARGPDGLVFPWGDTFAGLPLNFCDASCGEEWADADYDDGYEYTAPVGSYPEGISWVGAFDLAGNVSEWVSSIAKPYPYDPADGREDLDNQKGERGLRGGSWKESVDYVRASNRHQGNPGDKGSIAGFRCARDYP